MKKGVVLTEVLHSDLATAIVIEVNKNSNIRISGDYKITVNTGLNIDILMTIHYQKLKKGILGGEEYSSKTDLKNAYFQRKDRHTDKILNAQVKTKISLRSVNKVVFFM